MKYIQILIIAGALLMLPWLIWLMKSEKPMAVVVVNNTTKVDEEKSQQGLYWILDHLKVTTKEYKAYQSTTHNDIVPEEDLNSRIQDADLIYLGEPINEINSSSFSGESIKKAVTEGGSSLLIEYNGLSSIRDKRIRDEIASMAGITLTGWTGKAFNELSSDFDEIPLWAIKNYEKTTSEKWDFSGAGLVFVNAQTENVVVFSEADGMLEEKGDFHLTFTEKGQEKFRLKSSSTYDRWFEVIQSADLGEDVLAVFTPSFTQEGRTKASEAGLPDVFPAIVGNSNISYFAGNFTEVSTVPERYKYAGYSKIRGWLSFIDKKKDNQFFWSTTIPLITKVVNDLLVVDDKRDDAKPSIVYEKTDRNHSYSSRIKNNRFEFYQNGKWVPSIITGVNLGMGKPGAFPGEAAITRAEYDRWFKQIGELNANTIRVYTLHPPAFYDALLAYNETHDKKLYILHGVWADEAPLEETLDAFTPEIVETFEAEMKRIADVIHGNATVEPRVGHASGVYTANISPYVSGWVLGIEWYPYMVDNMKTLYADTPQFKGERIRTVNGEGFELWLAERMDNLLVYEEEKYGWTRPMSFTNWVTTDHLKQKAEPSEKEDVASVNPDHIVYITPEQEAGMFASYHVYPYYPDFLNLEEKYTEFIDHRGEKNNYAGYLHDLHQETETPILIAEFGIPGSRGMTHENISGWNQGFHSEKEQGELLVRLYEDIIEESLMGGLVFTWQDEWFKRTWNTMDLDDPDRRPFWSNVQTNEQNFGLLSFNSMKVFVDGATEDWKGIDPAYTPRSGDVEKLFVNHDEAYLYVRADLKADAGQWLEDTNAHLFLDVLPGKGSSSSQMLPNVTLKEKSADFHIALNSEANSHAFVGESYDPFLYLYGVVLGLYDLKGESPLNGSGTFNPIRFALNKEIIRPDTGEVLPFSYYETGKLRFGNGNPDAENYDSLTDFAVSENGKIVELRIPWLLLNVKDPSEKVVMGDLYSGKGQESEVIIESIGVTLVTESQDSSDRKVADATRYEPIRYTWDSWEFPEHGERLKKSYDYVQKVFKEAN